MKRNGHRQFIGMSAAMVSLREEIDRVAQSDAKVLVLGESGVGKELVANAIHAKSRRSQRAFVAVNCAGIPETLLESELFGHVRGSFTGAYRDKAGKLSAADGGTIFLDEIGEMSLRMQGMLLRFLETGEMQRVGAAGPSPVVDVRTIAATNRSLRDMVAEKTFRGDLFYRLNVIHIQVPPLRERLDDVPVLARYFLDRFCRHYGLPQPEIAPAAFDRLLSYRWPGNVRELRNVVERTVVRLTGSTIHEFDPSTAQRRTAVKPVPAKASHASVAEVLFDRIVRADRSASDGSQPQNFWTVAYEPFMARDLTRAHLRDLVTRGLQETRGSYRVLAELFGIEPNDYKRFLSVLRKHRCHVPFQPFRKAVLGQAGQARLARLPLL